MIVRCCERDINAAEQRKHETLEAGHQESEEQQERWEHEFGQAGKHGQNQVVTKDVAVKTKAQGQGTCHHTDDFDGEEERHHPEHWTSIGSQVTKEAVLLDARVVENEENKETKHEVRVDALRSWCKARNETGQVTDQNEEEHTEENGQEWTGLVGADCVGTEIVNEFRDHLHHAAKVELARGSLILRSIHAALI